MEEFVCKGVAVERLVFEQSWMQADGDITGVKAKAPTAGKFVAAFFEAGHAQTVVVHVQPLNAETVGDPRPEDGFHVTGKRRQHSIDHVFGDRWWFGGYRRVGEWPTLLLAHVWATKHPLQEA